jgi:oligopeptide/dipeptide ABC transporter ATP-binding protein
MSAIAAACGLSIEYQTSGGRVRALDGADLVLEAGASLGLVGESGSGKTTLGLAMGRLLPANARLAGGSLRVGGRSVFELDGRDLLTLRKDELGYVFQSPMSALNPTARVGKQVAWSLGGDAGGDKILALLRQVGLPDAQRLVHAYPHELSGGMAQRVAIAMAIARRPRLLIADEPTASLDASIRAQILDLLLSLKAEIGATLVLLSHELAVVARTCEMVGVMYGGRVVEFGPSAEVLNNPVHPYTRGLLRAAPGSERPGTRLAPIPGTPPILSQPAKGCSFRARCSLADARCEMARPVSRSLGNRSVLCHHADAA